MLAKIEMLRNRDFETVQRFEFLFLQNFDFLYVHTYMVQMSLQNSCGKVVLGTNESKSTLVT